MSSKTIKNREKSHTTEKTTPISPMELFMELKLKRMTSLVKWSRAKQGLNNQNQKRNHTPQRKTTMEKQVGSEHGMTWICEETRPAWRFTKRGCLGSSDEKFL